jgi:electron transfer flavoprotein beta subunit
MFNIVVCVKAVPDPKEACNIKIDPHTKTLLRCDVPLVINPLDKNAIEAALQLKEQIDAHISVLSMGPPEAGNIVKECLALGADQGFLLCDPAFGGADAYAEWVGPEIATFLNVPVVTMVKEIVESERDRWKVKASLENGYRLMQVKLPAVFTVTRDLNTPRTLSFSGIIKARKKEITQWAVSDLGVPEEAVGLKGSPTIVSELSATESKREVEMIAGTRDEKVAQLVQKLADVGVL